MLVRLLPVLLRPDHGVVQDGEANVAQGVEAVRRRLEDALNGMEAGSLSDDEAFKRIDSFKARWPSISQAQAELTNSRRRPQELQLGGASPGTGGKAKAWKPQLGDSVRLLRIGDSSAKVGPPPIAITPFQNAAHDLIAIFGRSHGEASLRFRKRWLVLSS